jgi:hypothetical protein
MHIEYYNLCYEWLQLSHRIIITNVKQSNANSSPLALACSRILLVEGGVYCIPRSRQPLGFLPTYLPIYNIHNLNLINLSSKERISQRKANRQPLHSEMHTSPLAPSSLGSSWTISQRTLIPTLYIYLSTRWFKPMSKEMPKQSSVFKFICIF